MSDQTVEERRHSLSIPFPLITRRNRRKSQSERALETPTYTGKILNFCRQKGHGFITPDDEGEPIFVHITDIEGEFVPHEGDLVEYKKIFVPPKNIKFQAMHVRIVNFSPGRHETWEEPVEK